VQDQEIIQLARRIQLLSQTPEDERMAHWNLLKIHDASLALLSRLELDKSA
jgi:hypothetical protein